MMHRCLGLILIVLLAGCSGLNADFECARQPGVRCKSVGAINALVDQGKFKDAQPSEDAFPYFKKGSALSAPPGSAAAIWIAPYTDARGYTHEATWVHMPQG